MKHYSQFMVLAGMCLLGFPGFTALASGDGSNDQPIDKALQKANESMEKEIDRLTASADRIDAKMDALVAEDNRYGLTIPDEPKSVSEDERIKKGREDYDKLRAERSLIAKKLFKINAAKKAAVEIENRSKVDPTFNTVGKIKDGVTAGETRIKAINARLATLEAKKKTKAKLTFAEDSEQGSLLTERMRLEPKIAAERVLYLFMTGKCYDCNENIAAHKACPECALRSTKDADGVSTGDVAPGSTGDGSTTKPGK